MQVVILAGGKGQRMGQITQVIPKPLIPIGNKVILEIIIEQLRDNGAEEIILCVNYLSDLIESYFKNGEKFGVRIKYVKEDKCLGTAGALSLINGLDEDFLVMNADILTDFNYYDFYCLHKKNKNDISISSFSKEVKVDLGVIKKSNNTFIDIEEKPSIYFDINMGIYALNKNIIDSMNINEKVDMPELIKKTKGSKKIMCYDGNCEWIDIGNSENHEKAISLYENTDNWRGK